MSITSGTSFPIRQIGHFPCYAILIFNEKQWIEACEKYGIKDRTFIEEEATGGVTQAFGNTMVVKFNDLSDLNFVELAGLVCHEMVHVHQLMCQFIGEINPSMEFEAYTIQFLTQWALEEIEECYPELMQSSPLEPSSVLPSDGTSGETTEPVKS